MGEERERALASYGLNLGICFQMVDDLLDFTAEEKALGKPVANDLREGKLTLPVIFLLRRAGPAAAEKVQAVLEDRGFERVTRDEIVRLAREHGALDEARDLAERYADARPPRPPGLRALALPRGARGAARLHPRPRPLSPGGPPPMTTREQAEKRIASAPRRDPPPRAPLLRPRPARDLRPGVRRASTASCATSRRSSPSSSPRTAPPSAWGRRPSEEFPTFAHRVPMLSLDNTYSEDELREFEERIFRVVGRARDRLHGRAEDRRPLDGAPLRGAAASCAA